MRKVPVNNSDRLMVIDDNDYDRVTIHNWNDSGTGRIVAWLTRKKSINIGAFILNNKDSGLEVDHIDRDIYNNQLSNLRLATKSQNVMNRKKPTGSSKYKGVTWFIHRELWMARIGVRGRNYFLGYFESDVEAAKEYNKYAKIYHGEFAVLNNV